MRRIVLTVLFAAGSGLAAVAQIGNPALLGADTRMEKPGVPAPHQTNNQDRLFARLFAAGGLAEVEFARLSAERAAAKDVKDFADMMIKDHEAANRELKELADAAKIPLPNALDPDHAEMKRRLEGLEGKAFDAAYMAGQVADHQRAALLLQWEINNGQDAQMQRFAMAILPKVQRHLELAQKLQSELTGAAMR